MDAAAALIYKLQSRDVSLVCLDREMASLSRVTVFAVSPVRLANTAELLRPMSILVLSLSFLAMAAYVCRYLSDLTYSLQASYTIPNSS